MALRKLAYLVALAGLAAGATSFVWQPPPYDGPLEVSFWYWHRPFRISRSDSDQLRKMGVRRLFVHSGTFSSTGGIHVTLPQIWQGKAEQEIVLVFNAHTDLLRDFVSLPADSLARALQTDILREIARARNSGLRVSGVQLDIDSPTRLLGKYSDLLRGIGQGVRSQGTGLSITVLPTWFQSPRMRELADSVDFIVPQFYEAETPKDVKRFVPISSLTRLERGLRAAKALGKPFLAGLPAYGHALVYSGTGKLLGGYHDMDVAQALRHPGLKLVQSYPVDAAGRKTAEAAYIGENVYRLVPRDMRLEDPDAHDQPDHGMGRKPYHLVYDVPSPKMVAQNLQVLREGRPSNCKGLVFYRFPERGEVMALPLSVTATVMEGRKPAPHLSISVSKELRIWDVIDTGSRPANAPCSFSLVVTNDGSAGTAVALDAVDVAIHFKHPGIEAASAGGFDSVESYLANKSEVGLRSSIARANSLRFSRAFLGAGDRARIGPIQIAGSVPNAAEIEWTVSEPGGYDRRSDRTEVQLR